MAAGMPTVDLVRSATDELVLAAFLEHRRLTRAEVAAVVGISKPTASESVRRLAEAGLLHDTGERTSGVRGRVGSYYALAADVGRALVVAIAPEGVVAEAITVHGDVAARAEQDVTRPADADQVAAAMRATAEHVSREPGGPIRLAVVSAADPVDRASGRLVHLPDAPFLIGDLDPTAALAGLVDGAILVDNDVNWAAQAERAAAAALGETLDDFAYLYIGEGLGCAVVSDGQVRRGHTGLAGEIAHVVTTGPQGQAMHLTEVFASLDLRRPAGTAINVDALLEIMTGTDDPSSRRRSSVTSAVTGVLAALTALVDPQTVVFGGPVGGHPAFVEAIRERQTGTPREVAVRAAAVVAEPAITGARTHALDALRVGLRDLARVAGAPAAR